MEEKMWLLTLGPGKARQGEFLREAESWRRYVKALAYLSSRSEPKPDTFRNLQVISDSKLGSAVCMDLESYKQSLSTPHQFEEVSVASDE
jgi:hypothetical protein